jgi:cobalt-zinc-cadmium efflux system membrane fusion protein
MTSPRARHAAPPDIDTPPTSAAPQSPEPSSERTIAMTNPGSTPDHASPPPRDWRSVSRRRWPLIAAALAIVLLAAWALLRRGSSATSAAEATPVEATAGSDSTVHLDTAAMRLAGVDVQPVTATGGGMLTANGTITYDANHVSVIASRTEGRVVSVRADLGAQVAAGAVLAVVESQDVGQTRGDLERARANVDVARRNYEREKRLFEQEISPQKEMLDAEAIYRSAEADLRAATARLRAIGASAGEGGTFYLTTPIGGTVVERNASPGQTAGPATNLFTVADLRRVWITVDVYERDLARVRRGARATVVPTALPSEGFAGTVTFAGGIVDTATRTFKVRVEVDNTAQRLRPGMFAQVRIETPVIAGAAETVTIPEVAVQDLNGKPVVFVAVGAPGQFVARPVTVGQTAGGGMVTITDGLRAGERIAVKGAFQLKAELTKASFGEEE